MFGAETEWLASVKAGDSVIIESGNVYTDMRLRVAERVTPKHIVVDKLHYRKENGRIVGGNSWSNELLRQPTQERLIKIRRDEAVSRLENARWGALEDSLLFAMANLLETDGKQ